MGWWVEPAKPECRSLKIKDGAKTRFQQQAYRSITTMVPAAKSAMRFS
jgi:hypothetical protein